MKCPVCFKKFSVLFIEEHAADCSSKLDVYVNSTDEMEDGKIDINDVTVPYGRKKRKQRMLYKKTLKQIQLPMI